MANSARDDGTLERVALDRGGGGIRIERRLNAPVREVWDALTRPDRVSTWLARADEPPGRGKKLRLHFDNSGADVSATVTELEEARVLEYRWDQAEVTGGETAQAAGIAAGDGGSCRPTSLSSTVIRYELAALGDDSTLLTLTHRAVAAQGAAGGGRENAPGQLKRAGGAASAVQSDVVIASWQNHLDGLAGTLGGGGEYARTAAAKGGQAWDWGRFEALRSRYQELVG